MSPELKLIYGHLKFLKANALSLTSRRCKVDTDMFVVGYVSPGGIFTTFSVTLKPVEHFERLKRSEERMIRIRGIKRC